DGRAVQCIAPRERHRQLHQDRATGSRPHPARRRCIRARQPASRTVGNRRRRRAPVRGRRVVSAAATEILEKPPTQPGELALPAKVFAFATMSVGFFIALLDIQIVSASLGEIGGGLSAGPDEIAWVQTSYLIAEIVVIPLSGWLSRVMSTRWLFCVSAAGFTVTSLLCGW